MRQANTATPAVITAVTPTTTPSGARATKEKATPQLKLRRRSIGPACTPAPGSDRCAHAFAATSIPATAAAAAAGSGTGLVTGWLTWPWRAVYRAAMRIGLSLPYAQLGLLLFPVVFAIAAVRLVQQDAHTSKARPSWYCWSCLRWPSSSTRCSTPPSPAPVSAPPMTTPLS